MNNLFPPVTRQLLQRVQSARSFNRMAVLQQLPGNPYDVEYRQFGQATAFKVGDQTLRAKSRVEGLTEADIDQLVPILEFYRSAGVRCQVPVSSAHFTPKLAAALVRHGLVPAFQTVLLYGVPSVYYPRHVSHATVEELGAEHLDSYLDLFLQANEVPIPDQAAIRDLELAEYQEPGMRFFIAAVDGEPAATGSLCIAKGIGFLVSAATLPALRTRGCQSALIHARFAAARRAGCDLMVGGTMLFSPSHRNMQSIGMHMLDMATTWIDTQIEYAPPG